MENEEVTLRDLFCGRVTNVKLDLVASTAWNFFGAAETLIKLSIWTSFAALVKAASIKAAPSLADAAGYIHVLVMIAVFCVFITALARTYKLVMNAGYRTLAFLAMVIGAVLVSNAMGRYYDVLSTGLAVMYAAK